MRYLLFLMVLMLAGCGPTTQSGINKEYYVDIYVRDSQNVDFSMGVEADTEGDTKSGDAAASSEIDPAIALGMQGSTTSAAAKGAEQVLEDIMSYAEQWMKKDTDNVDDHSTEPAGTPETKPIAPIEVDDPETPNLDDYDVAARADCDKEMSYNGVVQKRCVFDKPGTEYGESFLIQWSSGNTLTIPNSSKMAMDNTDYRKYQPVDPEDESGNAGVYAGRGDTSGYAQILVKK